MPALAIFDGRFKANRQRSHLAEHLQKTRPAVDATDPFEQWIEQVNLLETDSSDWVSYFQMMSLRASTYFGAFAN